MLHSGLAVHRGRTVLELAVELRRTLFLATPEAQIVTNRVWRGRALTSWEALDAEPQDDGASSPRIKPDADTAEGAGQRASVLSYLTRARSSGRHPAFWVYVWPLFAAAVLPLLALAPPQMLRERIFKQLYSPAERYWAAQACYVCFVILLLHLESCDSGPGCGARMDLDLVLVVWVGALVLAEAQAAWHVARARALVGQPVFAALHHHHMRNTYKRLDLLGVLVAVAACAVRVHSRYREAAPENNVRAAASLLLWSRLLSMLSIHEATGPLLSSIRRMVEHDISRYCLMQVMTLITFAAAFVSLYNGEDSEAGEYLGTPRSAVTVLCEITLLVGEPHSGNLWELVATSHHPNLGWVILAGFAVFSVLLLINLLIGLLEQSYETVRSKAELEYAHGRTQEVLRAAALPVVPPPFNLVQVPAAVVHWIAEETCCAARLRAAAYLGNGRRSRRSSSSLDGGDTATKSWAATPRQARAELFARAWDDVGWQPDPAEGMEAWKVHVIRELAASARHQAAAVVALRSLKEHAYESDELLRRATLALEGAAARIAAEQRHAAASTAAPDAPLL